MAFALDSATEKLFAELNCVLHPKERGLKIGGVLDEFLDIPRLMDGIAESRLCSNHFIVGDKLAYIDEKPSEPMKDWIEIAATMTGLDKNGPKKWANTCGVIPFDERNFDCEWTHYETVGTANFLSPSDRLALLSKYEREPLQKLKAEVKALNPKPRRRTAR